MNTKDIRQIALAGGCFWGVEEYYRRLEGVTDTYVGYAQGDTENPTYEAVCTGKTGHVEAVMVMYDHTVIPLNSILDHYFRIIDPTLLNQQGNDKGTQYRTGLYPETDNEVLIIKDFLESRAKDYRKPIVVELEKLNRFYKAEPNHQMYLHNNPNGYCHVDFSVIRDEEKKQETVL